jgi:hypothetical protein
MKSLKTTSPNTLKRPKATRSHLSLNITQYKRKSCRPHLHQSLPGVNAARRVSASAGFVAEAAKTRQAQQNA